MGAPRFLVSDLPSHGQVHLDSAEARHASNVLRLGKGDPVVLFDGRGGEAMGSIQAADKKATIVSIHHRSDTCRELRREVTLFAALPKGDRQKALIDGLTQLGITKVVPLLTSRGVAQPTQNALERLRKVVVESSKQCGRNLLMHIDEPVGVTNLAAKDPTRAQLFAHPHGSALQLNSWSETFTKPVQIAIGPEGGFTDDEVSLLRDFGWTQFSLGSRILRVEMAAFAIATWAALNAE